MSEKLFVVVVVDFLCRPFISTGRNHDSVFFFDLQWFLEAKQLNLQITNIKPF